MSSLRFRALFSDIGGVLGTNGWDGTLRTHVCQHFAIEQAPIEERHRLMFDTYERGHMRFSDYLQTVFFAEPRPFTLEQVRDVVYQASQPWPDNLRFLRQVKEWNPIKIALISNEGEGITQYRIEKFGLRDVCDFMVISHFTGFRKPDPQIWRLALNLAAVQPEHSIYIDDRLAFAEAATELGLTGIHHTDLHSTRETLARLGLQVSG